MPSVQTSSSRKLRVFNTSSGTSHSKLYRTLLPSGVDKERRIEEKQCKELRRGAAEKYNLLAGNLGIELDDEDGAWITTGDIYDIPEGETMEEASVLETSHAGREQYKILYNEICQATRRKGSSTRRDRTERLNEGFARQTKAMVEAYMDWSYRTREGGLESCLAPDARDASAQGTSTIILLDIFRTYTCHVFLSRVFTKTQQKQM